MKIMGEFGLGLGVGPNNGNGFFVPLHGGAMAEFYFPKFGGLGVGGGISGAWNLGISKDGPSAPYVELDYIFVKGLRKASVGNLFARYHFIESEQELLPALGFGIRLYDW
jgi:hypothetical protein